MSIATSIILFDPPNKVGVKQMSKILVFLSDNQEYSVDISYVKEIRNWTKSTIVPNSPDFLEGIINIRGSVIPLINFSKKIILPQIIIKKSHYCF